MIVKEMKKISMDLILVILEKDNQRTLYGFFLTEILSSSLHLCLYDLK